MVVCACSANAARDAETGDAANADGPGLVLDGNVATAPDAGSCAHSVETGYSAGPDGIIGTLDDPVVVVSQIDFETVAGKHRRHVELDDQSGQKTYARSEWDAQTAAYLGGEVWTDPGSDGVFGTADDIMNNWNKQVSPSSFFDYMGPGPDGVWMTSDDDVGPVNYDKSVGGVVVESYDSGTTLLGASVGPDGQWGTADDTFAGAVKYFYDAAGNLSEEISLTAGPDGVFDTGDDVIAGREVFPCQSSDRVVMKVYAPGPDGVLRTADDVVTFRTIESGDFCETLSCSYAQPH